LHMEYEVAISKLQLLLETERIQVRHDPSCTQSAVDEVLIGLGSFRAEQGIHLNHKGTGYASVSELVLHVDQPVFDHWKALDHQAEDACYVIEDISPDTCLAFIIYFFRICEVPSAGQFDRFVEYVNRWERGDVKTTGEPFSSWGCLHNALSHSFFIDMSAIQRGFSTCTMFTLKLLQAQMDPSHVQQMNDSLYYRATGFLQREYQEYLQALKHGSSLQLAIPLMNSTRKLLVDAFICRENSAQGALKSFLRNDRLHTYFQTGFSLMAVYRPEAAGTGNDMVISVDPTVGIYLKELWAALEEMENKKWLGRRPSDLPRFPKVSNANQPWFHDMEKYTLIAAPKLVNAELGTKLVWQEVVQALWDLYQPAKSIYVQSYVQLEDRSFSIQPESCFIYSCSPLADIDGKRFIAMKWTAVEQQALLLTPTLQRIHAACIFHNNKDICPSIEQLPSLNSFELLEIIGGVAIIHEKGILLLDDWNQDPIGIAGILEEFTHLLTRNRKINSLKKEVNDEIIIIQKLLENKRSIKGKQLIHISSQLSQIKLELRQVVLKTLPSSTEYSVSQFRLKLEERWSVNTQLDQLYTNVSELEGILKSQ
jgi:hypothetical protein